MPSFVPTRAAISLVLAALAAVGGCSRRADPPPDTGTARNQSERTETSAVPNRSAPDTQNLAFIRAEQSAPAARTRKEPVGTSRTPISRAIPSPSPTSRPDSTAEPALGGRGPAVATSSGSGALLAREPVETAHGLPVGTTIRATLQDSINSRDQSAGQVVAARIRLPIKDRSGRVVLPAGSRVELSIAEIEPAKAAAPEDARLVLQVDSILVNGRPRHVRAEVAPVAYQLQGRGVTGKEAGKVGIGAGVGAVLGRVLSGKTRGAVVGGVVGAAGGAAVAARRARKDVVVKPGTELVMVLKEPLVLPD
jgi:hypothetical protein